MADETKEEKEAREAEEAQKLADEEAVRKAAESKPSATPAKDVVEELAGKDASKFTASEMVDYIDRLKDENARRRIANRTLKDSQDKMEKKLSGFESKLVKAETKLGDVETEKKKSAEAEKSEVERLKGEVVDFKTKLETMSGRVKESDEVIRKKDLQIKKQGRETEVGKLLQAAKVQFSSDYERQGFMADLLKTDTEGDFVVNEEEVNYKVGQFVKKAKDNKPPVTPETPPAGPTNRSVDPALNERIKALTAKASETGLTEEDSGELQELLDLAGQAADWDPRRQAG